MTAYSTRRLFHAEVSARMDAVVHPLLSPDTPSQGVK
jgi:hypothetical protein